MKRNNKLPILIFLIISFFMFSPISINAKEKTSSVNWKKPVRVQMIKAENNNLFIVKANNETFKVSMIGIDVVDSYKGIRHREKDGKVEEYEAEFKETNIFDNLISSNSVILELDDSANKYNKKGIIQAWFWVDGELYQNKLISEGRAILDVELCKYSSCNKYYDILLDEQEYAKKQLIGLWGAKDVKYVKNVGGAKRKMYVDMTFVAYLMISVAIVLIAIIAIILVKSKKEIKKLKNQTAILKEDRLKEITEEAQKEIQKETHELGTLPISEPLTPETNNIIPETTEIENKIATSEDNPIDTKESLDTLNLSEKNMTGIFKSAISLDGTKDMLLKVEKTLFTSDDNRSKEIPEVINISYVIIDEDTLESSKKEFFIKPMRNPKLTKLCKAKTKYRQDQINNGVLLDEAVKELFNDLKDVKAIYVWGTSSSEVLVKDSETKLSYEDYELMKEVMNNVINYKTEFAERQEISPCGLSKAMEIFGLPKSENQLEMLENVYKAERE